jgi:hydrogenase maturation protease
MSAASIAEGNPVTPACAGGTLVVGLGNPLLADDGVGWLVAQAVAARLAGAGAPGAVAPREVAPGAGVPDAGVPGAGVPGAGVPGAVEVDNLAVGGLALMERLVGYRRAVLVDAMVTGEHPPGTVRRFTVEDAPGREATHLDSAHDASLAAALAAGRALGADLPDEIVVIAVEAVRVDTFGEQLTPEVEAAIPAAIDAVLAEIGQTGA